MSGGVTRAYYEQSPAEWAAIKERLDAAGPDARILLKGATVITVDPEIGDFDEGDVLIRGKKIEAVGADLSAAAGNGQTIVIEMGGMIVMPGIVDGHRHCWQNQFRRVIPDADLTEYVNTLHGDFAVEYRPHDMYVGNFLTMLTLLDAGVTTITDCSHNTRSSRPCRRGVQVLRRLRHPRRPCRRAVLHRRVGGAPAGGPDPASRRNIARTRTR